MISKLIKVFGFEFKLDKKNLINPSIINIKSKEKKYTLYIIHCCTRPRSKMK
jgi:hypothetical protein